MVARTAFRMESVVAVMPSSLFFLVIIGPNEKRRFERGTVILGRCLLLMLMLSRIVWQQESVLPRLWVVVVEARMVFMMLSCTMNIVVKHTESSAVVILPQ